MAGVYIKGMEMPGSCGECRFLNPGNYKGKEYPCVCDVGDFLVKPSETDLRDGLCPLVEVPDHGDLVDRGALEDTVLRLNFPEEYPSDDVEESWEITRGQYKLIDNVLFEMPVVIPADKEE